MSGEGRRPLKITYTRHPDSLQNKPLEPETPERCEGCDGCGVVETTVPRKGGGLFCDVCAGQMASRDAYVEEVVRILEAWRVRRKLTGGQLLEHVEHAITLTCEETQAIVEGEHSLMSDWELVEGV